MSEATDTGVSAEEQQQPPTDQPKNPRDELLDGIDEKLAAQRQEEHAEFMGSLAEEDPEIAGELQQQMSGEQPPPEPTDGAQAVEPMHTPPEPAPLPAELQNDPLADFIEMHNNVPMFKTVVDGQPTLIPLDRARTELQKRVAGDIRMQQAAETTRQLEERERQVQASEAALAQRTQQLAQTPPPSADPDADLVGEAKEIVSTLFTGNEDEAATKLATLLARGRVPAQAPIDTQQIVQETARVVRSEMTQEQMDRDAKVGYDNFARDFPDIMADGNLYRMADQMTDDIAKEHPEWLPSQIMQESGTRVRAWANQLKGASETDTPPNTPGNGMDQRQERKQQLKPIPQAAGGAQQVVGEPAEQPQTPSDALKEIREARGQPV